MQKRSLALAALLVSHLGASLASADPPSLEVLADPGASSTQVTSMSADGSVVAGLAGSQAFLFRDGTLSLVDLTITPPDPYYGEWAGHAHVDAWLSDDGETLVVGQESSYYDLYTFARRVLGVAWRGSTSTTFYQGLADSYSYVASLDGVSKDGRTAFIQEGTTAHSALFVTAQTVDTQTGVRSTPPWGCVPGFYPPGDPSAPISEVRINGVSDDGSVVVGDHSCTRLANPEGFYAAFRWTPPSSISYPDFAGRALGVSGDGSTVIGREDYWLPTPYRSFVWSGGTTTLIQDLPGMVGSAPSVWGVSDDGSVLVGTVDTGAGRVTYRWEDGVTTLLNLPGVPEGTSPTAMTSDGSAIAGRGRDASHTAFYWDARHGARSLTDLLEKEQKLDITGWEDFFRVVALSDDGKTLAGDGRYQGTNVGFRAELDTPPMSVPLGSPVAIALLTAALLAAALRARNARTS